MKICKTTQLIKHGDRESADKERQSKEVPMNYRLLRCKDCKCLHVFPWVAETKTKSKKKVEETKGTGNYTYFDVVEITQETNKALLIVMLSKIYFRRMETWIPKSQIIDAEDYKKGDKDCTICVYEWFAKKEGLVE